MGNTTMTFDKSKNIDIGVINREAASRTAQELHLPPKIDNTDSKRVATSTKRRRGGSSGSTDDEYQELLNEFVRVQGNSIISNQTTVNQSQLVLYAGNRNKKWQAPHNLTTDFSEQDQSFLRNLKDETNDEYN